jgi:hypothetical protein
VFGGAAASTRPSSAGNSPAPPNTTRAAWTTRSGRRTCATAPAPNSVRSPPLQSFGRAHQQRRTTLQECRYRADLPERAWTESAAANGVTGLPYLIWGWPRPLIPTASPPATLAQAVELGVDSPIDRAPPWKQTRDYAPLWGLDVVSHCSCIRTTCSA